MISPELYAVTDQWLQPLAVPADATDFSDLYTGLALGVYSSVRTFRHNQFLQLGSHLARTVNSMRLLGWTYTLDEARLRRAIHTACTAYPAPEMRVRIDLLAEPATSRGSNSRELIALMPFSPPPATLYETGVTLGYAAGLHRENPLIKRADFANRRKGTATAEHYEQLLLTEDGQILEATSANFYAVRAGEFYTADEGVLEGVTRRIVLALVTAAAIPLHLRAIHRGEGPTLTEALISSSSPGIVPVVRIGEHTIGDSQQGPVPQQLIAQYHGYVEAHLQTAIDT